MKLKNKKTLYFLIVGLVVTGSLIGWCVWPNRVVKQTKEGFSFAKVKRGDLEEKVTVSGQVDADEKATLKFQASGKLAWVGVKEGDRVKKWQAVASLDKTELKKKMEKEMNDFLTEKWDFDQTHDNYQEAKDNALITDEIKRILDKAQFSLSNTVLDVELADLAVKYATIYSPIAGIVTAVEAPLAGVNITPVTAEFEIVNPDSVYLSAKVDEMDVGQIKAGQETIVTLDAYSGETFKGEVLQIAFSSVSTSGGGKAFLTKVSLPQNDNLRFKLGMGGDAEILVDSKENVLLIPADALVEREKNYVWTVDNQGKAHKKEIKIGLESEDNIEITDGLLEGDEVIVKGLVGLKEGQKIR